MLSTIIELWPIILLLIAIAWGLIEAYFLNKGNADKIEKLEVTVSRNEETMNLIKTELHETMKENSKQTNGNFEKLTKAVTELVTTTQVLATKIEFLKDGKKGCENNCNCNTKPARSRRSNGTVAK
ncbi:hypothetical protein [Mongoliitalea daihaiensis]|uniref:hypothetical protein n=1 Tax=Mongoliitalea daihaiensis TaxID=2782006 RepID=UPI001F1B0E13|nr:hypothetical protein [Mongoliitalea daihaiensis]UJP63989.1 hypothetical protein IPZ59_14315 [Mongoliitalea daihaiensis]